MGGTPATQAESEPIQTDLETVIKESQAALSAQPEVKPKRGRKPGGKNRPKEQIEAENSARELAKEVEAVSLAPMLGMLAGVPFAIAADRTKFDKFQLQEAESQRIGVSLDLVVKKYMPQLSEKAGVELMCCFTIVTVVLTKYGSYQAHLAFERERMEKTQTRATNTVQVVEAEQPDAPPVSAGAAGLFSRG